VRKGGRDGIRLQNTSSSKRREEEESKRKAYGRLRTCRFAQTKTQDEGGQKRKSDMQDTTRKQMRGENQEPWVWGERGF